MNKERWQQITAIVDRVLNAENKSEQTSIIRKECGDDQQLRVEIESFLNSIEESAGLWDTLLHSNQVLMDNFVKGNPNTMNKAESAYENPSEFIERVGAYRIKKRIGVGGMGEVFLADHSEGKIHQNAALKLIRFGIDSNEQIRRFEQEKAILSSLNHPNIARLLDGGVAEDGRPYYVMEYVDGQPITEYCSIKNCSFEQRLNLFVQVCKAVQYAHTNFIVHRDLKPDNLLVNNEGLVKVLDFGIAKLLDAHLLGDQTLFETHTGQHHLSLSYAAPEQLTLEPVTTATDVYVLGLLLFELLTEKRPFQLKGKTLREAESIIRHQNPEKPSSSSTLWPEKLKGDLDAIILKALRKEPESRYETVGQLADDIDRYISYQPVHARKGTVLYKSLKFWKRNRAELTAFILILSVILSLSTFYGYRINQEKIFAENEARKADQVSNFLISLFESTNPFNYEEGQGLSTSVGTILESGIVKLETELRDQPRLNAELKTIIGQLYKSLGEFDKAEELLTGSIALMQVYPDQHQQEIARSLFVLADIYLESGRYDEADSLLQISIQKFEQSDQGLKNDIALDAIELYGNLSWFHKGDFELAEELLNTTLNNRLIFFNDDFMKLSKIYSSLATLRHEEFNLQEADSLYRKSLEFFEAAEVENSSLAVIMSNFSILLMDIDNLEEARVYQEKALQLHKMHTGEETIDVAIGLGVLASINLYNEHYIAADSLAFTSIDMFKNIYGDSHPFIATTQLTLGESLIKQNRFTEASEYLQNAYDMYQEFFPPDHSRLSNPLLLKSKLNLAAGNLDQALQYSKEALEIRENNYPENSWRIAEILSNYGHVLSIMGRTDEADSILTKSYGILLNQFGEDDRRTKLTNQMIAEHQQRMK